MRDAQSHRSRLLRRRPVGGLDNRPDCVAATSGTDCPTVRRFVRPSVLTTGAPLRADLTFLDLPFAEDAAGADIYLAIDGIDPVVVPGVILPAFGGLSYSQVLNVILGVAARARIVGASFVEYVPAKDPAGIGAKVIARLACVAVAAIMRGRK